MSPSGQPLGPRERDRHRALKNAQIRRRMLAIINAERGNHEGGWMTGRYVLEVLQMSLDQGRVPKNEDHASDLISDLVNGGYATEDDGRESKADPMTLDSRLLKVTTKGTLLISRQAEPDLLIADYRHAAPFNQE